MLFPVSSTCTRHHLVVSAAMLPDVLGFHSSPVSGSELQVRHAEDLC